MHVAFWCPAWPLQRNQNGIVTYVHWMKHALESSGHRVSVFTSNFQESTDDNRVYKIGSPFFARVLSRIRRNHSQQEIFRASVNIARAIKKVHRYDPIDIIEMEESFGWFADVAQRTSLPTVVKLHGPAFLSYHGGEIQTSFEEERVAREGAALRKALAISSPSRYTLERAIERYGLHPKIARHIVNPMALADGWPIWNLQSCNKDTILFVGRFDLIKGGDVVLNAFRRVLDRKQQCRLIFVGPDVGLDSAATRTHFNEYRDSIFPVELRDRVDYRGTLPPQEIAKLRAQATVTVVASRQESFGYTLLEAMLQGCPIVSTNAGGCPETLSDGESGLLAKSADPQDFAEKLISIMNDSFRAAALGKAARARSLEAFAPQKVVAQTLELYDETILAHRAVESALGASVER